jgi:hypothetical protein
VAFVRTDISGNITIIRVERITGLGTLAVTDEHIASIIRAQISTLMMVISYPQTSVLARATRRNIPEDGILQSLPWKPQILHSINRLDPVAET